VIWLNPAVLVGLGVVAAPLLVHFLVQRRAERFLFPTLRFLRPARLASVRRHVLDDVPLLVVRCAILSAAVGALAGPLVASASRRATWDRRVTRAVVRDGDGAQMPPSPAEQLFRAQTFSGVSLRDSMRRALAWLETAPPSRRELLIVSPLPIGSITAADLAAVPPDVGIRFERAPALPATRMVPLAPVLTTAGVIDRTAALVGPATSVDERTTALPARVSWPIEVTASANHRLAVDAATDAVLGLRVPAPPSDRRVRVVILEGLGTETVDADGVRAPWVAEAITRMARDSDLQAAARGLSRGIAAARFSGEPWRTIARASDGAALIVAAATDDRLVIVSGAPASDVATPILLRAAADAVAPVADRQREEIVSIADDDLRTWSRPSGPVAADPRNIDEDDRRWLWAAALLLLAFETWLRRTRRSEAASTQAAEAARVA
jgi:aerotolerance regulator-like protein